MRTAHRVAAAAVLLPMFAAGLECTNLTYISKQDLQVEIAFPVFQNAQVTLYSLPQNGTLYEQETLGTSGGRVQGEAIAEQPFALRQFNIIYYRPFPKQVSPTLAQPLSEFFYGVEQAAYDGSAQLQSERCWVRVTVQMYPETTYPFSGAAGQALFFDGADDHVHTPVVAFPATAFTVSLWVRTAGRRRPGQSVLSYVSTGGREIEIRDLNDVRLLRGTNETASAGVSVNDGKWHQLAVTWQVDGRVRLFVDGRCAFKTTLPPGPPIPSSGSLVLGQSAAVNYTSARESFRVQQLASATHGVWTSTHEKTLLVNRIEALSEIRSSDAGYRDRPPSFLQGVPRGCACRGGAFDHARSYHGFVDELRIYSAARSELELQLDMHTVLSYPSIRAVSNASLYIYYTMEAANRWTQHLQNDFDFATRIPGRLIHGDGILGGVLGADGRSAAPLRVDSDAPLVGAKVEHRSIQMGYVDGNGSVVPRGGMQLIRLALVDVETDRHLLYARIEVLPSLGVLWQVDEQGEPSVIIDRGDGRTRPLVTNTDWLLLYQAVDLGQPDVYRYNDDGELVLIDTRQDNFMVRIHDVEFLPPERIDPDNPPPWISTEYILRPAWLPLPLNKSISVEQGTVTPLHLRALQLDEAQQRPLILSIDAPATAGQTAELVLPGAGSLWMAHQAPCNFRNLSANASTCAAAHTCCVCPTLDCGRLNLCAECSAECRQREVRASLTSNAPPVCASPASSSTSSSTASPSTSSNLLLELLPYSNPCAYLWDRTRPAASETTPGGLVCRALSAPLPATNTLSEVLVLANVTHTFAASHATTSFHVTSPGQANTNIQHPQSVQSQDAKLYIQTRPVNTAPQITNTSVQKLVLTSPSVTSSSSASSAASRATFPPRASDVLEASDPEADEVMYSISSFPQQGTLHLPLPPWPEPRPEDAGLVGSLVRERAQRIHQWPSQRRFIQGPEAMPPNARRLRWSPRPAQQDIDVQCGSKGIEALEARVERDVFVTAVTLEAMVPMYSPVSIYALLSPAQSMQTYRYEDTLQESTSISQQAAGTRSQQQLWAPSRTTTSQRRVQLDSGGWVEVWRGLAEHIHEQAGILHVRVPTVEVVSAVYRVVTCGGWSFGAVDNSSVPSYLRLATGMQVEGFYGNAPARVPAARITYVPSEGASGEDGFVFVATDGDLRSEHEGKVSMTIKAQQPLAWARSQELFVTQGSATPVDLISALQQSLPSALRQSVAWRISLLPAQGEVSFSMGGKQVEANKEFSQAPIFYIAPASQASATTLRYQVRIGTGEFSPEGTIRINVVCKPGHELRRPLLLSAPYAAFSAAAGAIEEACTPCSVGTFNPVSPSAMSAGRCLLCAAGTFQPTSGATACIACTAGKYSNLPGATNCAQCGQGTYSKSHGSSRCAECASGEMMPTSGATHCFACGLGAFNYARGRATCTSCPALTRTLELRSASELDCLCAVGSFDAHGCAGVECEHCPQGATCYGGRNAPASNAGYWTDAELWLNGTRAEVVECNFRSIRDNCRGVASGMDPSIGFTRYEPERPSPFGIFDMSSVWTQQRGADGAQGGRVAAGSDVGSVRRWGARRDSSMQVLLPKHTPEAVCRLDNPIYSKALREVTGCEDGYAGRLCSTCSAGYAVSLDLSCDQCPGDHAAVFFFAIILVLTGLGFLLERLIRRREAQVLFLFWAQNLATLIHWTWPMPNASKTVVSVLSLFNLNHHILPWACYGMGSSWASTSILLSCIPWASACGITLAAEAYRRFVYWQALKGVPLDSLLPAAWQSLLVEYDSIDSLRAKSPTSRPPSSVAAGRGGGEGGGGGGRDGRARSGEGAGSRPTSARSIDSGRTIGTSTGVTPVPEWEKRLEEEAMRFGLVVCDVMLVPSSIAALQLLDCTVFADQSVMQRLRDVAGTVYPAPRVDMTAYPTFECFTKAHTGSFFLGFTGVAFNLVVCPVFLFYRLGLAFLEEKMSEPDMLRSFGDFYGMYERKYWWWHAVVLVRRWAFVLTCSLLSPIGYFQVLVGIGVSAASILVSVLLRPYKDDRYNLFDLFLQAATLLLVASAVANTMTMSIARTLSAFEWGPAMLFWLVVLLVVAVSAAFILNIHPLDPVQVPETLVQVSKGLAGDRLEAVAVHTYQLLDEWRRHVLETHELFKYRSFPVDLPPAPKKEKPPPPLTAEEEYLASLEALAGPTGNEEQESPARRAMYESISAVKGLPWDALHDVHVEHQMLQLTASENEEGSARAASQAGSPRQMGKGGEDACGVEGVWGGVGCVEGGRLDFVGAGRVKLGPVASVTNAWEDLPVHLGSEAVALSHAAAVRRERQDTLQAMNRQRAVSARALVLHAHERKLNVLTKARIAQSKAKFFELSKKAYRTSAKVEHTLNMLAAMRQHVQDTDMALRAEDYKHSYLLARLEVEEELIPDQKILALEMEAMDRRAASLRQEQEAARSEILLFQKAVAEELYESDSDEDAIVMQEMMSQDHLAAAAAAAASAAAATGNQSHKNTLR